jgi:hypothetical protein
MVALFDKVDAIVAKVSCMQVSILEYIELKISGGSL